MRQILDGLLRLRQQGKLMLRLVLFALVLGGASSVMDRPALAMVVSAPDVDAAITDSTAASQASFAAQIAQGVQQLAAWVQQHVDMLLQLLGLEKISSAIGAAGATQASTTTATTKAAVDEAYNAKNQEMVVLQQIHAAHASAVVGGPRSGARDGVVAAGCKIVSITQLIILIKVITNVYLVNVIINDLTHVPTPGDDHAGAKGTGEAVKTACDHKVVPESMNVPGCSNTSGSGQNDITHLDMNPLLPLDINNCSGSGSRTPAQERYCHWKTYVELATGPSPTPPTGSDALSPNGASALVTYLDNAATESTYIAQIARIIARRSRPDCSGGSNGAVCSDFVSNGRKICNEMQALVSANSLFPECQSKGLTDSQTEFLDAQACATVGTLVNGMSTGQDGFALTQQVECRRRHEAFWHIVDGETQMLSTAVAALIDLRRHRAGK